jgi:hypothetical protein
VCQGDAPKHLPWSRRGAAPGLFFILEDSASFQAAGSCCPHSLPARHDRNICMFASEQVSSADVAGYIIMSIGDVKHMSKEEAYRLTAAEIVECARQATSVIEKRRLLRLAEMWLDLAVRSGRKAAQAQRRIEDHPLVRKTLGSGPAGAA